MLEFVKAARDAMGTDGSEPDGRELHTLVSELGASKSLTDLPSLLRDEPT